MNLNNRLEREKFFQTLISSITCRRVDIGTTSHPVMEKPSFVVDEKDYGNFLVHIKECDIKIINSTSEGNLRYLQLDWAPLLWIKNPILPGVELTILDFSIIDTNHDFLIQFEFNNLSVLLVASIFSFREENNGYTKRLLSATIGIGGHISIHVSNVDIELAIKVAGGLTVLSKIAELMKELKPPIVLEGPMKKMDLNKEVDKNFYAGKIDGHQ